LLTHLRTIAEHPVIRAWCTIGSCGAAYRKDTIGPATIGVVGVAVIAFLTFGLNSISAGRKRAIGIATVTVDSIRIVALFLLKKLKTIPTARLLAPASTCSVVVIVDSVITLFGSLDFTIAAGHRDADSITA